MNSCLFAEHAYLFLIILVRLSLALVTSYAFPMDLWYDFCFAMDLWYADMANRSLIGTPVLDHVKNERFF